VTGRGIGTGPLGLLLLGLGGLPGCVCVGLSCGEPDPIGLPDAPVDDDDLGDDDDATANPVITERSCAVQVRHTPVGAPATVEVAGEFNAWTPAPMTRGDDGVWTADLGELPAGSYAHKFLFDGAWEGPPPPDAYAKWVDGTENRALYVGDCAQPLLQVVHATATPSGTVTATLQFATAADGEPLDASSVRVEIGVDASSDNGLVSLETDAGTGQITATATGLPAGKHSVRAFASDTAGRPSERPVFVPLWVEDEPFAWEDGLIYFAFVDRFRNGDYGEPGSVSPVADTAPIANYQGGDFLGVLDALEDGWFEQLGANVLWLTPVYENPDGPYLAADGVSNFSGFHGYWPTDPFAIEGKFGDATADSEERLIELITEAHARGIRVLFDLVLNHVHEDHTYRSEHPEWFTGGCVCGTPGCGWDERARDCWFQPYLPDLDYRNPWVLERVVDDTVELVRRFDVDGVRVDAAKHMDHVVMRTLSRRLREDIEAGGGSEVYAVGETFTGGDGHSLIMEYVSPDELDAQFDFPLYWSIREAFAHGGSFQGLETTVATGQSIYGEAYPRMSPFLGNHDILRFATDAAGNAGSVWGGTPDWMAEGGAEVTQPDLIAKQSMAFAFTLTQPGLPLIYYGDEIGLAGAGDPDNRRLMTFDPFLSANQAALLERVRAIGQTRASSEALRRGDRTQLWVDDDLLVYARDAGGDALAVVAMNKAWTPRVIDVPIGPVAGLQGRTLRDAIHPERSAVVEDGTIPLELGPWEYAILLPE
jgi:glycosidase